MRTTAIVALVLSACGPSFTEQRTTLAAARSRDCQIEWRDSHPPENLASQPPSPNAPPQVFLSIGGATLDPSEEQVGEIEIDQGGTHSLDEYREAVRKRACAMGGEGVSLIMSTTDEGARATSIQLMVWRRRR